MMMPPQQHHQQQHHQQPQDPFGRSRTRESATAGLGSRGHNAGLPGLGRSTTRERARPRTSVKLTQLLANESRSYAPAAVGPGRDLVRLDSNSSIISESQRGRGGRGASPNRQHGLVQEPPMAASNHGGLGASLYGTRRSGDSLDDASAHSSILYGNSTGHSNRNLLGPSSHNHSIVYGTRNKSSLEDSNASFFYDPFEGGHQQQHHAAAAEPRASAAAREPRASAAAARPNAPALPRGSSKRMERYESRKTLEELAHGAQDQGNQINEEQFEMEIAPGHYVPFRNANEVWQAVERNCVIECMCLECGIALVCVADAEHVICPDCNMVNPVFDRPAHVRNVYGAGMGLKKEWTE